MKTLYLVRHTKSSWRDEQLEDIDRPLKAARIEDAYLMAKLIKKKGIFPDVILSSPATRAIHTAIIFARVLEYPAQRIVIRQKIYEANKDQLLHLISRTKEDYDSIMVFGHNPTFTNLHNQLCDRSIDNIPTTGAVGLKFDVEQWEDLKEAKGKLLFFEFPKTK